MDTDKNPPVIDASFVPPLRRRSIKQVTSEVGSGSLLMAMSLFIMLLAFFIMLNAISTFQAEKVNVTIASVQNSFTIKKPRAFEPADSPDPGLADEDGFWRASPVERLEALFNAHIPAYRKYQAPGSIGTMAVRLPRAEFDAALVRLQPENIDNLPPALAGQPFLNMLVALVRAENGQPYRMDISVNIGANPAQLQVREPLAMADHVRMLDVLAQKIEQAGLPSRLFSIGLRDGPVDTVDLLFRPHEPFNPLDSVTLNQKGDAP